MVKSGDKKSGKANGRIILRYGHHRWERFADIPKMQMMGYFSWNIMILNNIMIPLKFAIIMIIINIRLKKANNNHWKMQYALKWMYKLQGNIIFQFINKTTDFSMKKITIIIHQLSCSSLRKLIIINMNTLMEVYHQILNFGLKLHFSQESI